MKAVSSDKEFYEQTARSFDNMTQPRCKWRLGLG